MTGEGTGDGRQEVIAASARRLIERLPRVPSVCVVLGSGLGALEEELTDPVAVPFAELPPIPAPSVTGHGGRFVAGRLDGVDVLVQAGRVHLYEGVSVETVAAPVRILAAAGVETLVVTNAVGGVRPTLEPGDIVLIADQINLTFRSPLAGTVGPGEPRFPDMSRPFDPGLQALIRETAARRGIPLRAGTYLGLTGPSYETPAEVRMLARLGADVVGMSTVSEVIVAHALGVRTAVLSLVTNKAAGLTAAHLEHQEVLEVGRRASERMAALLRGVVSALGATPQSVGAK